MAEDRYRVEVFKGSVDVAADNQAMRLDEGKVWVQETASTTLASKAEKGITKDDWDQWTEARYCQAQLTGKDESVHPVGPAYGWSDLNTYGEWVTLPGNRFGWSPYAPAGWSPYSYGMWNSYGGMGWTWISADPWGWVTDHCGMWDFDPTFGWYWMNPMFGCGLWYPSLVNWFGGPGWYGWAPIQPGHPRIPPGCSRLPGRGPVAGHRGTLIVKVPASVIQKGQMVTAQVVTRVPATDANKIEQPPAEASPRTTTAGNGNAVMPGRAAPLGAHPGFGHATAPATVLMGGEVATEGSLLAHHGLLGAGAHAPLRLAKAQPWGGRYPVQGAAGEFHGSASSAADGTATLGTPAVMGAALLSPAGPVGPELPWLRTDQVAAVRAVAVAEAQPPAAAGVASGCRRQRFRQRRGRSGGGSVSSGGGASAGGGGGHH